MQIGILYHPHKPESQVMASDVADWLHYRKHETWIAANHDAGEMIRRNPSLMLPIKEPIPPPKANRINQKKIPPKLNRAINDPMIKLSGIDTAAAMKLSFVSAVKNSSSISRIHTKQRYPTEVNFECLEQIGRPHRLQRSVVVTLESP